MLIASVTISPSKPKSRRRMPFITATASWAWFRFYYNFAASSVSIGFNLTSRGKGITGCGINLRHAYVAVITEPIRTGSRREKEPTRLRSICHE